MTDTHTHTTQTADEALGPITLAMDALLAARNRFVALDPDWDQWHLFPAAIEALNTTALAKLPADLSATVQVKPLDMSNLLRHAFISGYQANGGTVTGAINYWPDYNPEECSAYSRILSALSTPQAPAPQVPSGALADVAAERCRQVDVEGWTAEHDDSHTNGEMASAGAAYAIGISTLSGRVQDGKRFLPWHHRIWPWDLQWWKPSDRRRNLVKAAALIVAEIERLDRSAALLKRLAPRAALSEGGNDADA